MNSAGSVTASTGSESPSAAFNCPGASASARSACCSPSAAIQSPCGCSDVEPATASIQCVCSAGNSGGSGVCSAWDSKAGSPDLDPVRGCSKSDSGVSEGGTGATDDASGSKKSSAEFSSSLKACALNGTTVGGSDFRGPAVSAATSSEATSGSDEDATGSQSPSDENAGKFAASAGISKSLAPRRQSAASSNPVSSSAGSLVRATGWLGACSFSGPRARPAPLNPYARAASSALGSG